MERNVLKSICIEAPPNIEQLQKMGERDIIIGELEKKYSVKKLLDGIEDEKERRRTDEGRTMGGTGNTIIIENKPQVTIENKPQVTVDTKVIQKTDIDINIKVEVDLPQIKSDFDELKSILDKARLSEKSSTRYIFS